MMSIIDDEYEALKPFHWNEECCRISEVIDKYSLPQVIQINKGYDGGLEGASLGHGEFLTLHTIKETEKLTAEDKNGNKIFINLCCPYKCYLLPHLKDSTFEQCTVTQLPIIFPKVKYFLVSSGHYGTENQVDTVSSGDLLEILSVEKRKKEIKVQNVRTNEQIKLTTSCSAEFKPVENCTLFTVKEIKNLFSFPNRIRFVVANETNPSEELLNVIESIGDLTVQAEFIEELVVATSVESSIDLKSCFEIPKELDLQGKLPIELLINDKSYDKVVEQFDQRFDASKFLSQETATFFRKPDTITEYKYDAIPDVFIATAQEENVLDVPPPLIPRREKAHRTQSLREYSPEVKPSSQRRRSEPHVPVDSIKYLTIVEETSPENPADLSSDYENLASPSQLSDSHSGPMSPPLPPRTPKDPMSPSLPPKPPAKPPSDATTSQPPSAIPSGIPQNLQKNPKLPPKFRVGENVSSFYESPTDPQILFPFPPSAKTQQEITPPTSLSPTGPFPSPSQPNSSQSKPPPSPKPQKPTSQVKKISHALEDKISFLNPTDYKPTRGRTSSLPQNATKRPSVDGKPPNPRPPTAPKPKPDAGTNRPLSAIIPPNTTKDKTPPPSSGGGNKNINLGVPPNQSTSPKGNPVLPKPTGKEHPLPPIPPKQKQHNQESTSLPFDGNTIFQNRPLPHPEGEWVNRSRIQSHPEALYDEVYPPNQVTSSDTRATTLSEPNEDPYEILARIPKDITGLTVTEVAHVLKLLHLGKYAEEFRKRDIDGRLMEKLGEVELESLNVNDAFDRKKLIEFIGGWRPKHV